MASYPNHELNETVFHEKYGKGIVKDIDSKNKNFFYLVYFNDGTKVWLPKNSKFSDKPIPKSTNT